jgi:hypothetical protein
MLDIKLIGDFKYNKLDISNRNYIESLSIDCIMKIMVDNRIIYDDWVCPLELYFQLVKWNNSNINGHYNSFYYISDDNGVNPIFSIELLNNKKWIFKNNLAKTEYSLSKKNVEIFYKKYKYEMRLHENPIRKQMQ